MIRPHRLCADVMELSLAWGLPEEHGNFLGGLWALLDEMKMVGK